MFHDALVSFAERRVIYMKGTGNSGKGRFWLTLALVMTLIVIAVTISTTIGAVNVSFRYR